MNQNLLDVRKSKQVYHKGKLLRDSIKRLRFNVEIQMDRKVLAKMILPKVASKLFSLDASTLNKLKSSVGSDRNERLGVFRDRLVNNLAYSIQRVLIFQNLMLYDMNLYNYSCANGFKIPKDVLELSRMINQYCRVSKQIGSDSSLIPQTDVVFKQQVVGSQGGKVYRDQFMEDVYNINTINEVLEIFGESKDVDYRSLLEDPIDNFDFSYDCDFKESNGKVDVVKIKYYRPYEIEDSSFFYHSILMPKFIWKDNVTDELFLVEEEIDDFIEESVVGYSSDYITKLEINDADKFIDNKLEEVIEKDTLEISEPKTGTTRQVESSDSLDKNLDKEVGLTGKEDLPPTV